MVLEQNKQESRLRFYDPFGRHSTLTFNLNLETGYQVKVSERFSRIDSDTASDQLELAYISSPGLWRMGRIDLPFGSQNLVRDYGTAVELSTFLLIDNLPLKIAVADNGKDQLKGVLARVGDRIGVSAAKGDHFTSQGTSLTAIRLPEAAPGKGRGFQTLLGVDARFTWKSALIQVEALSLRQPETTEDKRDDLLDISIHWQTELASLTLGMTRGLLSRENYYRAMTEVTINQKVSILGFLRVSRKERSLAIGTRIRF